MRNLLLPLSCIFFLGINLSHARPLKVLDIATGGLHWCALLEKNQVKCWGANFDGQLGIGDTQNRGAQKGHMGENLKAVDFGTSETILSIAVGAIHSCALFESKRVKCWGSNNLGQLGQEDRIKRGTKKGDVKNNTPFINLGTQAKAIKIRSKGEFTCVLLESNQIKCWGTNYNAHLGNGHNKQVGYKKNQMGDQLQAIDFGTKRKILDFDVGFDHGCALFDNHKLKCWGSNFRGKLGVVIEYDEFQDEQIVGDEPGEIKNSPFLDLGTKMKVKKLALGSDFTCVQFVDHSFKCWGLNNFGSLGSGQVNNLGGDPNTIPKKLPFIKLNFGRYFDRLWAGGGATCGRDAFGKTLHCWGYNLAGALGLGFSGNLGNTPDTVPKYSRATPLGKNYQIKKVVTSFLSSCAILQDDSLKCWGSNAFGTLGQEDSRRRGEILSDMGDHLLAVDLGSTQDP